MNIKEFLELRSQRSQPQFRELCTACLQPQFSCYCQENRAFDPGIKFVVLIHPIEVRRRIATGRMAHLNLSNSELIAGHDYSENPKVNSILTDPSNHCVMLYPGPLSANLSKMSSDDRKNIIPENKKLVIFVIDGTWATARKMVRLSANLKDLPRICFTPERPSNFKVRKQPAPECFSTIEAIHQTIELLGPAVGFPTLTGQHDQLLKVFSFMVDRQLSFIQKAQENPKPSAYRRPRLRIA